MNVKRVRRSLKKKGVPSQDLEDMVQDAVEVTLRRGLENLEDPNTFLLAVAKRMAIYRAWDKHHEKNVSLDDLMDLSEGASSIRFVHNPDLDALSYTIDFESLIDLKKALEKFSEDEQAVIRYHIEGYTWREIAHMVGRKSYGRWAQWFKDIAVPLLS